jgi:hypothetical protein
MESCFLKPVEILVAEAITELGNQPPWRYLIDGGKKDQESMANLFEVDNILLYQTLLAFGFYYPMSDIATGQTSIAMGLFYQTLEPQC